MDDSFHVAIRDSGQHLIKEFFNLDAFHVLVAKIFHVGTKILVKVLENQVQLFLINDHIF